MRALTLNVPRLLEPSQRWLHRYTSHWGHGKPSGPGRIDKSRTLWRPGVNQALLPRKRWFAGPRGKAHCVGWEWMGMIQTEILRVYSKCSQLVVFFVNCETEKTVTKKIRLKNSPARVVNTRRSIILLLLLLFFLRLSGWRWGIVGSKMAISEKMVKRAFKSVCFIWNEHNRYR